MIGQPVSKLNQWITQLSLLAEQSSLDELALRRIEYEVRQLLSSDASSAYMLLGVISSIRHDERASREHHERSLRLRADALNYENYGNSLGHLHCWKDAIDQFWLAFKQESRPDLLRLIMRLAVQSGQPAVAYTAIQQLLKLQPESSSDQEIVPYMNQTNLLLKTGLSDDDMSIIHRIVEQVAQEFSAPIVSVDVWADVWSGDELRVISDFYVDHPHVVDLEWRLIEHLVETDLPTVREGRYSVHFQKSVVVQ